jgi:Na+/proline symporter
VSDIGILNDPLSLILIALIFGSPGLLIGGISGALLWRRRRIAGALLGAVAGFALWLPGWMVLKDVI